jgi:hypothetical protein
MGKALGALCFASIVGFSALEGSAQNTANFQFLVEAEAGLRLAFAGFDAEGHVSFADTTTRRITYQGKKYYIVLVDEDVVFSGEVAMWCVQDKKKKWTLPAEFGMESDKTLCDRAPRDNGNGTYIFEVR